MGSSQTEAFSPVELGGFAPGTLQGPACHIFKAAAVRWARLKTVGSARRQLTRSKTLDLHIFLYIRVSQVPSIVRQVYPFNDVFMGSMLRFH